MEVKPIGLFHCNQVSPHESPRQGVLAQEAQGEVVLSDEIPMESLRDLEGFDRIWLIYQFHKNSDWKPLVRPPRGEMKRGVFATRSPYRPNGLGMSVVCLNGVKGRILKVSGHDLLNGTPILDIKPYLNFADSFPEAKIGWTGDAVRFDVKFSELASEKMGWLSEKLQINLKEIVENQLEFEPSNSKIKRVKQGQDHFVFSYKTWRIHFHVANRVVQIFELTSGYSESEMNSLDDPFRDKDIHSEFKNKYSMSKK